MKSLVSFVNEARLSFDLDKALSKKYKKTDDFIYSAKVTYERTKKTEVLGDLWGWKISDDLYVYNIAPFARNLYAFGTAPDGNKITLISCFYCGKEEPIHLLKEVDEWFDQRVISCVASDKKFEQLLEDFLKTR